MKDIPITVRLPVPLHESVKAAADENVRSLNGEIIARLKTPATQSGFTKKQAKALERAWSVLHYGYVADASNGHDPMKRSLKRDQAAAQVIHELLGDAG